MGASQTRGDAVDARVIAGVRDGTGRQVLTIASDAWPELRGMSHEADIDGDGLPDAWEREHGLNPDDGTDADRVAGPEGWTHLKRWLNGL